jgi:serine/threonine protein kinase
MQPQFQPEAGVEPFPGYKLIQLRGKGAFATVWETIDPNGESIALKFMSTQNTMVASREIRSLQAIQGLKHPHLSRIRQIWSVQGYIVIAMDLADASLLDLLMLYREEYNRNLDPDKINQYLLQVAGALDYINAKKHVVDGRTVGYQHGDIKPNNILLTGNTAQLADYGLATPTYGHTTPCHRQGTIEYAAPEVFQGYMTEFSDQFSLAVTYFLLRTGNFPYPAPPPANSTTMKGYVRPAPNLALLAEAERPVLARALSVIPQNRYANCTDFMNAIMGKKKTVITAVSQIHRDESQIETVVAQD